MSLAHTVHEIALNSGARGLLIDVPGAGEMYMLFSFTLDGTNATNLDKLQAPHILEHLVCNEPEPYATLEQFSQEFTKLGAYNNASTSDERIEYVYDCADMEWERILGLALQQIAHPKLIDDYMAIEQATVREEMQQRVDDDWGRMRTRIRQSLGLNAPEVEVDLASIDSVTLDDVRSIYNATHTKKNLSFVFAGNLSAERREKLVGMLNDWQLAEGAVRYEYLREQLAPADTPVSVARDADTSTDAVIELYIDRKLTRNELTSMNALRQYLTAHDHSPLYARLRNEGIAYGLDDVLNVITAGYSVWSLGTTTSPANVPRFCEVVMDEIERLTRDGMPESAVGAVQEYARAVQQRTRQSVEEIYDYYANEFIFTGEVREDRAELAAIKQISTASIGALLGELVQSPFWAYGESGNTNQTTLSEHYKVVANRKYKLVQ